MPTPSLGGQAKGTQRSVAFSHHIYARFRFVWTLDVRLLVWPQAYIWLLVCRKCLDEQYFHVLCTILAKRYRLFVLAVMVGRTRAGISLASASNRLLVFISPFTSNPNRTFLLQCLVHSSGSLSPAFTMLHGFVCIQSLNLADVLRQLYVIGL